MLLLYDDYTMILTKHWYIQLNNVYKAHALYRSPVPPTAITVISL